MQIKKIFLLITALITVLSTIGCFGPLVEIPPASYGKLSTPNGLAEGIIPASKIRLDRFCITCDSIIIAEGADLAFQESMQLFMPRDELNLTVEIRGIATISSDAANLNSLFSRQTSVTDESQSRISWITMQQTYNTYGAPIIRDVVRAVLVDYEIMQIMENRNMVSQALAKAVRERLETTPMQVSDFGLADVQPPPIIVKAKEVAKEREVQIQQAEAQKQVSLKQAEAALEVARKQQEVDLVEAETQVLVNRKLAAGVSPAFLAQRGMNVLEQMAQSDNKVFIVPNEALRNPALMMGITNNAVKANSN